MAMSIDKIFTSSRFISGPQLLFLALYMPFGIILFILRIFISLQLCLASLVLPANTILRGFVLRVLYTVMGIIVRERGCDKKEKSSSIIVTNHVTPFDHIAVSLVYPCISVSVYNLPGLLSTVLCYQDFGMARGREVLKNNIRSYLNKPGSLPILLHPEGATTNGNVAVMKYGSWAFEIDNSVLVIGLHVDRIPFAISPSVLGGSWTADLLFMLFSPFTVYTVRYIGKFSREESESVESFSLRAQKETAAALNLQTSSHTVADKLEYIKRLAHQDSPPPTASVPAFNADVRSMAFQVKEVLPHLPINVIERDLRRTRNIDTTITNFLEGTLLEPLEGTFLETTPPPSASPSTRESPPTPLSTIRHRIITSTEVGAATLCSNDSVDSLNVGAKVFGKTAPERMLSFHERKNDLVDRARRKYIKKHDLKIKGYDC